MAITSPFLTLIVVAFVVSRVRGLQRVRSVFNVITVFGQVTYRLHETINNQGQ